MDLEILTGGCHFDLNCIHSIDNLSYLSLKKKKFTKKKNYFKLSNEKINIL